MFSSSNSATASRHLSISYMLLAATLAIGCVALALPVSGSSSTKHDLNNLMSLLGKLKDAQRIRHDVLMDSSGKFDQHARGKPSSPLDAVLLRSSSANSDAINADFDDDEIDDDDASSSSSSSLMSKRQGAWSFDYGLGGGRFGKRGYGYPEYGLGGGRFGRDVDHVDPNHDVDIESGL